MCRGLHRGAQGGLEERQACRQWAATLETYAYPVIGKLPVQMIETAHVMKILEPIWKTKTETASRVRGRIEKVLDRAKALKLRAGENPAAWRGHLDQLLPAKSQVSPVENHPALPYAELAGFMAKLRAKEGVSARALEFTILTVARTGDTIGAHAEGDRQGRKALDGAGGAGEGQEGRPQAGSRCPADEAGAGCA